MSPSVLTPELSRRYDEQGFLLVPSLFDADERDVWDRRFQEIVDEVVPPAKDMLVMRDVMVAKGAVTARSRLLQRTSARGPTCPFHGFIVDFFAGVLESVSQSFMVSFASLQAIC